MKNKYIDLIDQTYYFPQDEFTLDGDELRFHNIDLMELVRKYGAPLKFMYLPKISENIQRAKRWFEKAIKKHKYKGAYNYCYCTKSSHFKHVMVEALKNDIHMETSSAFDINIINNLINDGLISKETHILCNGFKRDAYIDGIADLINRGYHNCIPIIDNYEEINLFEEKIKGSYSIGIRIASEEDPRSEFSTTVRLRTTLKHNSKCCTFLSIRGLKTMPTIGMSSSSVCVCISNSKRLRLNSTALI